MQTSKISFNSDSFVSLKRVKYISRKRALGDVLWIEPVIAALAQSNQRIIVYTRYNELFKNYPFKNVVFKSKLSFFEKCLIYIEDYLNSNFFSVNLNSAYEKEPSLHFLNAYQKRAKLPFTRQYPKLYLTESEKQNKPFNDKYMVLHIESFSDKKFRQVYGINWEEIISLIHSKGYKVVQTGIKDLTLPGAIKTETTIRELITLIYNCSYFIGLDSGPSHIAAALGKPSIIFFGAVDPKLRHFPELFKGFLLKKWCEFDGNAKAIFSKDVQCTRTDNAGNPDCCVYTSAYLVKKIEELIKKYGL